MDTTPNTAPPRPERKPFVAPLLERLERLPEITFDVSVGGGGGAGGGFI